MKQKSVDGMLEALRNQLVLVSAAIKALEDLQNGVEKKRRGRPPGSKNKVSAAAA